MDLGALIKEALVTAFNFSPYIIPVFLAIAAWQLWLVYIRADYIANLKWALREIRIPMEIVQTPRAMEAFLNSLHQPSSGTWLDKFWKGRQPTWVSLEIISQGGKVRFFIRFEEKFKNLVESQLYAYYPEIEILPAEDYVSSIPYQDSPDSPWDFWGGELKLTESDALPIKTYIEYKLDKESETEANRQRVDPLVGLIETMGSLSPNDQIWVQIMVTATQNRKKVSWFKKEGWKEEGEKLVSEVMDKKKKGAEDESAGFTVLSPGQRERLEITERNLSKAGFDVGVRFMYFSKKETFNKGNQAALVGSFKYFNSNNLNGFKPTRTTEFDFPWEDPGGYRLRKKKRQMFRAYALRSYFYWPIIRPPFVLSAEELATLYHFPSTTFGTPSVSRIPTRSAEPPPDLPI